MSNATLGVRVDSTSTTAEFTLGEVVWVQNKAYVYIQANGIITGDGYVVTWKGNVNDAAMVDTDTSATTVAGMQVGVVECAFADNEYGWAQVYGPCGIRSEQDALANSLLGPTADAGQIDDAGATANLCDGMWFGTATGASDAVNSTGFLNWPQMKDRYTPA